MRNVEIDYSSCEIQNALRREFKKSDSMTYLKELCANVPKEQMENFTCYAMKSAYDYNRCKALDYMLSLEGRHEASLLVVFHTQKMLSDKKGFEKGGKMLGLICKHFKRKDILEKMDNYIKIINTNEVMERYKEISFLVFQETMENKNIKTKSNKI